MHCYRWSRCAKYGGHSTALLDERDAPCGTICSTACSAISHNGTPLLQDLPVALTASDQWYRNYLETVTTEQLPESIPFAFTDGDKGHMSREEMLIHLGTHSGYHCGEAGRIMSRLSLPLPWDTFAVDLHRTEPSRRLATRPLQHGLRDLALPPKGKRKRSVEGADRY
ncbi:hypothetical protein G4Q83_04720 [Xanthomonas theicola]|nr:hypothetical protein G4Q83_04720 [Xanthomonas theicola]